MQIKMKRTIDPREIYADIRVRAPFVIRADGRGFSKLLQNAQKPYDLNFAKSLVSASRDFFQSSGLNPVLAFLFSDEINLLFLEAPFNGRLEKLDSVVAGSLSGYLSLALNKAVSMDSRVILLCPDEIKKYLSERQDEAWRNHVFSYGFYALIGEGLNHAQAMKQLRGLKESDIHEMLFQKGTNLAKNPGWQKRGVLIYRNENRIVENWDLPLFKSEEGKQLLGEIVNFSALNSRVSGLMIL
ncbi:MAG: tRNA(His) guanylyltransferase Thg1 family protein [Methanotrichaceae archaeon]